MHNLFGDTDSIHVELNESGYRLTRPLRGDTVDSVLRYVHFDAAELLDRYREKIAAADFTPEDRTAVLEEIEAGLRGYTYLED